MNANQIHAGNMPLNLVYLAHLKLVTLSVYALTGLLASIDVKTSYNSI